MKRVFSLPSAPQDKAELVFQADCAWLAPLAGYSDLSFRLLCREFGAKVCETEMVSAKGLIHKSPGSDDLLRSVPRDSPLVVQLFGSEPEAVAEAVLLLRRHGYRHFDFNMGCPVRKVMRQKAGAALLEDLPLALEIASAMKRACHAQADDLPEAPALLGFKFRLNSKHSSGFAADFGRRLEDTGANWLCLHPRTAAEGYGGNAHWPEIARLVKAVNIPVIASGDLFTAEAGCDCLFETGASCLMYARGSLRNPYIFTQHGAAWAGEAIPKLDRAGLAALIRRHIEIGREYCGDRRVFGKIRSILPRYVRHLPGVGELRQNLTRCANWEELVMSLERFMESA